MTSVNLTTFEVLGEPKQGEFLRVLIKARSYANCSKTKGGDYWFAVVSSLNTTGSSSSPVIDYNNGTYSVDLFIGWSGKILINITLVHPSQAVSFLDKITDISTHSRIFWEGTFAGHVVKTQGNTLVKERRHATSLCYLDYQGQNSWKDKCAYTNPKALGETTAWVCDKPDNELFCDSLIAYVAHGDMISQMFQNISTKFGLKWLFEG